jgi:hypothetical protein
MPVADHETSPACHKRAITRCPRRGWTPAPKPRSERSARPRSPGLRRPSCAGQGGPASGAAGPASAAGSALGGPPAARRAAYRWAAHQMAHDTQPVATCSHLPRRSLSRDSAPTERATRKTGAYRPVSRHGPGEQASMPPSSNGHPRPGLSQAQSWLFTGLDDRCSRQSLPPGLHPAGHRGR